MKKHTKKHMQRVIMADDLKESVTFLLRLRLPWLVVGLLGGFGVTVLISRYEEVLAVDVRLAFFLPVIIYLANAVGSQTETIFIRNRTQEPGFFKTYLKKELYIGTCLAIIFGTLTFAFTYFWFDELVLSASIAMAMATSILIAPLIALFVSRLFQIEHQDPAPGAGPIKAIMQDVVSVLIYFTIASSILLV